MKLRAAYHAVALVFTSTVVTASFAPDVLAHGIKSVWRAPAKHAAKQNPIPPGPHSRQQGQSIYAQECRQCHGKSGLGDGALAPSLNYPVIDLRSPEVMRQSDGALYWKIRKGRGDMPSYRHNLSKEEVWHVINYMRSEFQ